MADTFSTEPNPPTWPSSVKIFRESDDPDWILQEAKATQDPWNGSSFTCGKHFSTERTALLFAPGTYTNIDVEIGYYVQLAGLGKSADDVKFVGGGPFVPALNKHLHQRVVIDEETGEQSVQDVGTCLDSFWRSAENFGVAQDLQWAVSQAAPLRRVCVDGDVYLHDGAAYASGGHLANAAFNTLYAGGQQQYLLRNVGLETGASGGAWSMVYVGCTGQIPSAAAGTANEAAVTVVKEPRVRLEKPYVAMKSDGTTFELRVPSPLWREDSNYTTEPLLDGQHEEGRDFTNVRVVDDTNPESIQEALDQGKDVVLSPGIYSLEETIVMRHANQVLLGLGLATLEGPLDGSPCITVDPGVPGVRIAGIMLEATENQGSSQTDGKMTLLKWGDEAVKDPGHARNPGALFDVFVRVGGATTGNRANFAVDAMMLIYSGNIIGDNLWIWRADHAVLGTDEEPNYPDISPVFWQSEQDEYRAETGIIVTGDDVTMYGLAVEHACGHQTLWSGERGAVHFYQCEFPYGVDEAFAKQNYRGYLVDENVDEHELHAPGVYSNFRNSNVSVSTAMVHPEKPGVQFHNPFTVKLDNQGGIETIVNGKGNATTEKGVPIRMTSPPWTLLSIE